jgi:hypothetical protein
VPVAQEAEEDELEHLTLADDRLLHFVEDLTGELADLCELHQMRSSESATRVR